MKLPQILAGFEAEEGDAHLVHELVGSNAVGGGESTAGEHTGTKALMLAILEDGLRALLDANQRVSEEAARWMSSRRDTWVFSFATVCQTLGLDPDAVRRAAQRMKDSNVSARNVIGRNRPNSRRYARVSLGRRAASKERGSA
jgi:hypothetical protein